MDGEARKFNFGKDDLCFNYRMIVIYIIFLILILNEWGFLGKILSFLLVKLMIKYKMWELML